MNNSHQPQTRLQLLFLFAVTGLVLHGAEEYQGRQLLVDPVFRWFADLFGPFTADQSLFLLFHILVLVGLMVSLMTSRPSGLLILHTVVATVLVLESYHFVLALVTGRYLPGVTTALLLLGIGIEYWRHLVSAWYTRFTITRSPFHPLTH